ncbi:MAG: hypothetical protein ACREPB_16630 [Arenimonas sp.]
MSTRVAIHAFLIFLLLSGCTGKVGETDTQETVPTAEETRAADEASLLETAKAAGVSDDDALATKAEFDKVYDETSAKMSAAEKERLARMKQLKDEACIENCSD